MLRRQKSISGAWADTPSAPMEKKERGEGRVHTRREKKRRERGRGQTAVYINTAGERRGFAATRRGVGVVICLHGREGRCVTARSSVRSRMADNPHRPGNTNHRIGHHPAALALLPARFTSAPQFFTSRVWIYLIVLSLHNRRYRGIDPPG